MQRLARSLILLALFAITAACVYQAPLSQGNVIDEEDLKQVEVGMTRSQVRFLLGTPMVSDPFNADRWDYVYYLRIGRDKASFKRWVSVYFDGDSVTRIERDKELSPDI